MTKKNILKNTKMNSNSFRMEFNRSKPFFFSQEQNAGHFALKILKLQLLKGKSQQRSEHEMVSQASMHVVEQSPSCTCPEILFSCIICLVPLNLGQCLWKCAADTQALCGVGILQN